jgi:sigma-E factor negative regulatory protein RseA
MADTPLGGVDISQSVSSAIAEEPTYASTFSPTIKSKLYSMGRFAVAASVAFVAIIGVQQLNQLEPSQQGVSNDLFASQLEGQVKGPASQYPSGFQPNVQARTVNAVGNVKLSPQPLKIIKLTSADIEALNDQRMRNYLNEIIRNQSRTSIAPVTLSTEIGDNISSQ